MGAEMGAGRLGTVFRQRMESSQGWGKGQEGSK